MLQPRPPCPAESLPRQDARSPSESFRPCSGARAARLCEALKFSKVSAVEYLLFKTTRELAFQNLCLRASELVCGSAATGCHAAEEPQRRLDTTRHCECVSVCDVCMRVCVRVCACARAWL